MEQLTIPNLHEDLGLEILTRLPYTAHRVACRVCRRWKNLLLSQHFYNLRKQYGLTRKVACLIQAIPIFSDGRKPGKSSKYGITVFDPVSRTWERVDPVPKYPDGLPFFCQISSCEGKLVVMGGWDPVKYGPVTDVFVYDLVTREWKQGESMPSKRSFFAIGSDSGRVYVAGGHDENKNALSSAAAYDVRNDSWTELKDMTQERDECEGVMIGNEFWVVSGYNTENQGAFDSAAEFYEWGSGQWKRKERAWEAGRCPRACVGTRKDKEIVNWSEIDSEIRVGTCGVMLGDRSLVSGSAYQGAPQGFYLGEMKGGQTGKLGKIQVPEEFSGFVQSGCCVEV